MSDVFLLSAARTAIGGFGGSLKDYQPGELGAVALRAAIERANVDAAQIGHVVMGTVIPTEPRDAYASRIAAVGAGIPHETPAFNVNRLCGSGMQAIISAAQAILLGDCGMAIGGGTEIMSRAAFYAPTARWGQKLGDTVLLDALNGALTDPFGKVLMGITAENVAERYGITREMQDALAVESQQRAAAAQAAGHFKDQIVPVEVKARGGKRLFDTDEHLRPDTTLESLATLKPVFRRDGEPLLPGMPRASMTRRPGSCSPEKRRCATAEPSRWLVLSPMATPGSIPPIWASVRFRRAGLLSSGPGSRLPTLTWLNRTRLSLHKPAPLRVNSASIRLASIRTAAAFPWAIRSARPGPFS
jgi:acetyl-CoA acetyltransferase